MSAVLAVEGVSKSWGKLRTLDDVSMRVEKSERRAIIGPNGAGKTTLFNIVGGQWRPSKGRIEFQGRRIDRHAPHRRARVGISRTFQITNLFLELTVLDNAVLALQGGRAGRLDVLTPIDAKRSLRREALELLERNDLAELAPQRVGDVAYGQQRLLEVAVALAAKPTLLLLDEPTAGLSPLETERMIERLQQLDPALTVILIEHDMDVCFRVVDSITVLHYGRVIADGDKEHVRADPAVQEIYFGEA